MTDKNDFKMHENNGATSGASALEAKEETNERKIRELVFSYMRRLGITPNLLGYKYLSDAIVMTIFSPKKKYRMTKELYPEIAKKNETTASRVERAMRNAIERAWDRGDEEFLEELWGYAISSEKGKPTNSEFISQIVEDICINNHF